MTAHNFPKPGPEHARLKKNVGTWDVDCTYFMGPDQPPMKVRAKETVEMLGEFWSVSRFVSAMFGIPLVGEAVVGYDPARKRWVGTWIDTFTPHYFFLEGNLDPEKNVLEMSGEAGNAQTGGMTRFRTMEALGDENRRVFEMFMETPQGEIKLFTYVYTRAKRKSAKAAKSGTIRKTATAAKSRSQGAGKRKTGTRGGKGKSVRTARKTKKSKRR